jgi:hypothetical protein
MDRNIWFPKQSVILPLDETEAGILRYTYQGILPKVQKYDPMVVHLDEHTTRWMYAEGVPEGATVIAKVSLIRDRREVESFQAEVEASLVGFADAEFPLDQYQREVSREASPGRNVTVTVRGPRKVFHYGAGGKLTPKRAAKVLGTLRIVRDVSHPYVTSIKVVPLTDGDEGPCVYEIRASIT